MLKCHSWHPFELQTHQLLGLNHDLLKQIQFQGAGSSLVGVQDIVFRVTVTEGKVKAKVVEVASKPSSLPVIEKASVQVMDPTKSRAEAYSATREKAGGLVWASPAGEEVTLLL